MKSLTPEEIKVYDYINEIEPFCVLCGYSNKDKLNRHHIRYGGLQGGRKTYIGNIIVLCDNCHRLVHSNKKYWQPKLIELDKEIRSKYVDLQDYKKTL